MSNTSYRFTLIVEAIDIIQKRLLLINKPEDFIADDQGITLLDSITIRLQTIGENLNKILKADEEIINKLKIDPLPIINFRNIVSHEYELLDYQLIYKVCVFDLPVLKQKIQTLLSNNNETV